MSLRTQILRQIELDGPISVADYMNLCLLSPGHGYYATRDPFGSSGDFITAPEVSQMFGELLGLCLAQAWMDQGRPDCYLAELGPGRGTLMRDVLRATAGVPGFPRRVVLVEASAHLRAVQRETLNGADVSWVESADALPDGPALILANEFFDALPVRQFLRADDGWCERRIGRKDEALIFGLTPPAAVDALAHRLEDTAPGDMVAHCPTAAAVMEALAPRIGRNGALIVIDYGDWRVTGDTFQAVKGHQKVDPLAEPGEADLTAHVEFEALTLPDLQHSGLTPQGVLLERLGITARAQALARNLTGAALENHIAAHRRLTHPAEMGTLFKAIAFTPPGAPLPPGFDPASPT
ncbi:SAM-dependent MidA family methyltransferase [Litoreibacter ponti]|uniref:SAM-dependent MidA family methyltransferase n=1 Tax=Litoreibacter ponti TaxID=1510457 RepID=A0A2T6BE60_9RHOB|nr:SAM-dependent methyltransferase [Litoreibacter ponti]PTX54360.1 SAM-dependent MidA family methyltransferase [Litoreibacter ponti]